MRKTLASKLTKDMMIEHINNGEYMINIAKFYGVGKDAIRRLMQKYELVDYYRSIDRELSKPIKFRINNPELKCALEKYGPLYNVVD